MNNVRRHSNIRTLFSTRVQQFQHSVSTTFVEIKFVEIAESRGRKRNK